MFVYKSIASFFGIGYIEKGAGTVAALVFCVVVYYTGPFIPFGHFGLLWLGLALLMIGARAAYVLEKTWGEDSSRIVVDEVLGMTVSILFIPTEAVTLIIAFVLFRFFDIAKPLYIRKAENLPYGWGVMMDDVLAGIYTNVLLQAYVYAF